MRCFPYAVVLCLGCSLNSAPIDSPGKRVFRADASSSNIEHLADASSAGRAGSSSGTAGKASATAGHGGSTGAAGRASVEPDSGTDAATTPPDAAIDVPDAGENDAGADATVDEDAGAPLGRTCAPCTATTDCAPGYACTEPGRPDTDGPQTRCYLVSTATFCPDPLSQSPVGLMTTEQARAVVCIAKYTCSYMLAHPGDAGL